MKKELFIIHIFLIVSYCTFSQNASIEKAKPDSNTSLNATATVTTWNVAGNTGINANTQFVGTIDKQPLRFRVNNIKAGELNPATGNIFWGLRAGNSNTKGFSNIAIGIGALKSNTVSSNLVAIGDSALFNNGIGNLGSDDAAFNTAIGSKSLFSNTAGSKNTAIGFNALFFNSDGGFNTAVGFKSLFSNTSGFTIQRLVLVRCFLIETA